MMIQQYIKQMTYKALALCLMLTMLVQLPAFAEENISEKQEKIEECYIKTSSTQQQYEFTEEREIETDNSSEPVLASEIIAVNHLPAPKLYILYLSLRLCD